VTDLDVAVRLRFLALGEEKLKVATKDVAAFTRATQGLSTQAGARLSSDLTRATATTVRFGGALDRASTAATRTAGGLSRIGREARSIDATRAAVDRMTKSVGGLAAAQGRQRATAGGGAGVGAGGMIDPETAAGGLALALRGVAPAAGAYAATRTARAALGASVSFETAMAEVKKKVNLPEGKSWSEIESDIGAVAVALGMARTEIAAIMAQGGQGNVPYEQLRGFAELSAKVAAAWDIPAQDAAKMMTEVRGATRWGNAELAIFAEKVNYLGDISAAAEKDIGKMWQKSGEAAKAAGVNYDEAMVALTALRSVGMEDDVASRFFGAFAGRLRNPDAMGKKGAAALAELGLTPKGVARGMAKDAMGTMIDLLERLAKARNQVAIANAIGGGEWFDEILRFAGALPELTRLRDALADSSKWRGSLDKSLAISLDTTEKKFERVKVIVEEIGASLTRWSLDPIKQQLDGLIERFTKAQATARDTGFLAAPGGGPIEKAKPATPVPFGEKNRELFLRPKSSSAAPAGKPLAYADSATPVTGDALGRSREAIAAIESAGSGGYAAVGPRTKRGDRAYGRYQMMGRNIGQWSQAALGRRLSVAEFMADRKAQDAIFDHQFGSAIKKYGNAGDAASVWFTGKPLAQGANRRDVLGTSGSGYVRKFLRHFVSPTLSGEKPATGGATPAGGPAPATPGRQSRIGGVHIGRLDIHGVKDIHALHRHLAALHARSLRGSRDGALHDIA